MRSIKLLLNKYVKFNKFIIFVNLNLIKIYKLNFSKISYFNKINVLIRKRIN